MNEDDSDHFDTFQQRRSDLLSGTPFDFTLMRSESAPSVCVLHGALPSALAKIVFSVTVIASLHVSVTYSYAEPLPTTTAADAPQGGRGAAAGPARREEQVEGTHRRLFFLCVFHFSVCRLVVCARVGLSLG